MDAQVLLLMDPGAELGWAELSERLPSGGGERKQDKRQLAICFLWLRTQLNRKPLMKSLQSTSKTSVSL